MLQMKITREHLRVFRDCQEKDRADWWAVFSTNEYEEVWPFTTRGNTPRYDRVELMARVPMLSLIARAYRQARPGGGRFFINQHGAYFHENEVGPYERFVEFELQKFEPKIMFVKK